MGVEEQLEEREVLDSIFPDEITDTADNAYRIAIKLEPSSSSSDEDETTPEILLSVSYPETYPDVAPNLDLSSPPNAPKYPYLDVAADKSQLLDSLHSTIEESLGMAMIFTLVSTLKESAETLIADRQRQQQELKDMEAAKAEEEANRKFHGTAVTRERFIEWRERFMEEMSEKERQEKEAEEAEERKKRGGKDPEKRLTGKQLWERGLIGKAEDELADGESDGIVDGIKEMKVGA